MPLSGSYYYPVVQKPTTSLGGGNVQLVDGIPAPVSASAGSAVIYIDSADGDLKIRFADGTVKTIVVDT